MNSIRKLIVTGGGTGYLPLAPGSWASAAVCLIFIAASFGWANGSIWPAVCMAGLAILASVACVGLGEFTQSTCGERDPHRCTIDEWAGQALTLALLPPAPSQAEALVAAGVGFGTFRLFDIVKPPPARRLEKLPAGWGILLDDVAAAVYAIAVGNLILRLALRW